jgi:hypothetical protein
LTHAAEGLWILGLLLAIAIVQSQYDTAQFPTEDEARLMTMKTTMKTLLMMAALLAGAVVTHADSTPVGCGSFGAATGACDTFTIPGTAAFNLPATSDLTGFPLSSGLNFFNVPIFALNGTSLGTANVTVFPLTNIIDVTIAGSPQIALLSSTALLTGPVNAESFTLGDHFNGNTLSFSVVALPEPGVLAMVLCGLPLLGFARKRVKLSAE